MHSNKIQRSKGPTVKSKRGRRHGKRPEPQVGDYVQWTSDGVDQFKPARKVRQIQDHHAWVDGSQTGIPISEVTVAEPPVPIPVTKLTTPAKSTPSDKESDGNEISVLVTPQGRLQISADLDVKGIGKLKQMLEQYEQNFETSMVTRPPTEAALSRSGTINGGFCRSANSRSRCRNRSLVSLRRLSASLLAT